MRISTNFERLGHWYVLQLLSYLKILGGFYLLLIIWSVFRWLFHVTKLVSLKYIPLHCSPYATTTFTSLGRLMQRYLCPHLRDIRIGRWYHWWTLSWFKGLECIMSKRASWGTTSSGVKPTCSFSITCSTTAVTWVDPRNPHAVGIYPASALFPSAYASHGI
jgi:hypothetical protein